MGKQRERNYTPSLTTAWAYKPTARAELRGKKLGTTGLSEKLANKHRIPDIQYKAAALVPNGECLSLYLKPIHQDNFVKEEGFDFSDLETFREYVSNRYSSREDKPLRQILNRAARDCEIQLQSLATQEASLPEKAVPYREFAFA